MATRTGTTRTTSIGPGLSAEESAVEDGHADSLFERLVCAYFACRKSKRNTRSALAFEQDLERNLIRLHAELVDGSYRPGSSVFFVNLRPKPREVWAADFRDRVVHHLIHDYVAPRFENAFIADSCACIVGRGTLYGALRLEAKIRSATQNWSRPVHYLKCDVSNFFVSIDKGILRQRLAAKIPEPFWMDLVDRVLLHDPRDDFLYRGDPARLQLVPAHKRLLNQDRDHGLPIGNLSSQFFANVYLDALDQFAKHQLRARHYVRYVDDFILLHECPAWLNDCLARIQQFLADELRLALNPTKTILQPVDRGVDFVGQVIKPWRRVTRRRAKREAIARVASLPDADVFTAANSYFGSLGQASASHGDRADLANALRWRGYTVNREFTKIYRKSTSRRDGAR